MREILFKGKYDFNNKWVYGFYKQAKFSVYGEETGHWIEELTPQGRPNQQYLVIAETIGQYIGFCDKKGVKIFEGDIVEIQHPCWTAKCITVFRDGAFYFEEQNNPVSNSQVRADMFLKEKWEIEVIRNIND